ncbi:GTP pyrophosphokinase [Thermogutta terrifontis]|uniref:GTP pyrophosphokinase n=1 Tax=Thermogutta terrifontis TaxID=1331910 RepID=A0A286RI47_9BACT|nr:HD domain-containing protein [Thermogutta terrifontis]ASV75641.1 GTP pyrophosphokinase [Thermogutta terrifontis]
MLELTPRFDEALRFAVSVHRHQVRNVTETPYVGHLLRVCGLVLEYGGTEDEAIAGLLHDALEDQNRPGLVDEIKQRFGPQVLEIVRECSDTTQRPKPPWRERKEQFLRRLAEANAAVRLVVAADKWDNVNNLLVLLRRFGPEIWQHFRGGREGTLWYYREIVSVLRRASQNPLILDLAERVEQLHKLAKA